MKFRGCDNRFFWHLFAVLSGFLFFPGCHVGWRDANGSERLLFEYLIGLFFLVAVLSLWVLCRLYARIMVVKNSEADLRAAYEKLQLCMQKRDTQILQLSQAVEQSANLVIITDRQGHIDYVNTKLTQVSGYSFEEVKGQTPRLFKSGAQSAEVYKNMWETLLSGREWWGELCNKKKNGEFYRVASSVSPIRDDCGNITHFLAIQEDITEKHRVEMALKKSEDRLLHAQKLEAIGTFSAGIAHEYNNHLTTIQGYVCLLLDNHPAGSKFHQWLTIVDQIVKKSIGLTQQILVFSRKQPLNMQVLNLNQCLLNLYQVLKETLGKRIDIHLDLAPDLWLLKGDAENLDQVVTNLIFNARDAMPDGGTVFIQTQNVIFHDGENTFPLEGYAGRFVKLNMTDTGSGMDQETVQQIFDPFFTTKKLGKGTGLGLVIVHKIVHAHRGWITVKSHLGQGTQFDIFFPAYTPTH